MVTLPRTVSTQLAGGVAQGLVAENLDGAVVGAERQATSLCLAPSPLEVRWMTASPTGRKESFCPGLQPLGVFRPGQQKVDTR